MESAQSAPVPVSYLIRDGKFDDAATVHALVFHARDPRLRWRSLADVQRSLDAGEFYLAFAEYDRPTKGDAGGRELVGTCYVKLPEQDGNPAEFGGAYIHAAHRRRRMGEMLSSVALADYYMLHGGNPPIMAHVKSGNTDPLGMLGRLGFTRRPGEPEGVDPAEYEGIEHMERAADGRVYAEMFDFPASAFRECIRTVLQSTVLTTSEGGAFPVRIEVFSYTEGAMAKAFAAL